MNNFLLISQILRSPWLIDLDHGKKYLEIANKFLAGQDIGISTEKSIVIQFSNQGVIRAKDFHNKVAIQDTFKDVEPGTIAIIPINGVMTKYDVCGWYGTHSLAALVTTAAQEKNISGIVLLTDTPGGTADGSLDLAMATKYAATLKPVIAYADGLMCSAGYRVGAQATSIVGKPGSTIGSIGTQVHLEFDDTQIAEEGKTPTTGVVVTADSSPNKNSDYFQAKQGNYKKIKSILNPLNELFRSEIKAARPDVPESAITGDVFISSEALKLNLIDSEGMLADAIALAESESKNFQNNFNMSTQKLTLGQRIKQFLGITDDSQQLTEQHAQSLEKLAEDNDTNQQTIKTHEQTIATQKGTLDAIQALFPGQTDMITAIKEVQEKAGKYDAANGGNQHRLDKDKADGQGGDDEKSLEQKLNELPHHQKIMESNFLN